MEEIRDNYGNSLLRVLKPLRVSSWRKASIAKHGGVTVRQGRLDKITAIAASKAASNPGEFFTCKRLCCDVAVWTSIPVAFSICWWIF